MITSLISAKATLGITGTGQDTLISALIPLVEQDFLVIRNKPFDTIVSDELIGFGDDSTVEFILDRFPIVKDSESIYVGGSSASDYTIVNSTGVITFTTAPEDATKIEGCYEAQVFYYPDGAELIANLMIGWQIQQQKSIGVSAESLGDHSITFDKSKLISGYPASVVGMIKRFATFV